MTHGIDLDALSRVLAGETESRRVPRNLKLKTSALSHEALLQVLAQQARYDFSNTIMLFLKKPDATLVELPISLHPIC